MDETLNDFVFDNGITANTSGNETWKPQANGRHEDIESVIDRTSQNEVIGNYTDDRIRDAVNSTVIAVENCMYDTILAAVSDVVIPRAEMAVRSITSSSGMDLTVQSRTLIEKILQWLLISSSTDFRECSYDLKNPRKENRRTVKAILFA